MQKRYVVVGPSIHCPFHVEGLEYVPGQSIADSYTLILLHATNLHKETFDSFVSALLRDTQPSSLPIRDVWSIDCPNSGSSSLNQAFLTTSKYKSSWTVSEYTRAVYSFLCSDSHGVDFRTGKLIGVAHPAGCTSLMLLHQMEPPSAFRRLILLNPAIAPNDEISDSIRIVFGYLAKTKKDTWPSRACAREEFLKHPVYKRWDPNLVELFVTCRLRETGDIDGESVTLACSKHQEAAYYSKAEDFVGAPANVFVDICREGKIPIHLFVAEDDEFKDASGNLKAFQAEKVESAPHGSVTWMRGPGGHMFPQVAPIVLAEKLAQILLVMPSREKRLSKLLSKLALS